MAFELVTGRAGRDHVTSDDVGTQNALLFGNGRYILDGLQVEVVDSNTLHVSAFNALVDGRHFRCSSDGVDLKIANGIQNHSRIDLVVLRYELETSGQDYVENGTLAVIQGESVTGEATVPDHVTGSIIAGDRLVEVPLFTVPISGIAVGTPSACKLPAYALPVANGGTGQKTLALARNAMGLGNTTGALPVANGGTGIASNPSMLVNLGTSSADTVLKASPRPGVTGILPVANGGTGQKTLALARNAMGLGNTTGALPVANGGTGAADAATARTNLGAAPTSHNHSAANITSGTLSTARGGTGRTDGKAANVTGTVAIANGGTGATNAANARTNLGAAASKSPTITDGFNLQNTSNNKTVRMQFWPVANDGKIWGDFYYPSANANNPWNMWVESAGVTLNAGFWANNVINSDYGTTDGTIKNMHWGGTGGDGKPYINTRFGDGSNYGITCWQSDARLKEGITDSDADALAAVNSIKHRSFAMGGVDYAVGYVAQELEQIDPNMILRIPMTRSIDGEIVWTGDYAYQIDERGLVPYLSKAIQELSAKVSALEEQVNCLKGVA